MLDRRLRPNLIIIFLAIIICLSLWEIITNPSTSPLPTTPLPLYPTTPPYTPLISNSTPYTFPVQLLPTDDYHQLINLRQFNFPVFSDVCSLGGSSPSNDTSANSYNNELLLLVLVHSAPKNFAKRKTIRETWGQYLDVKGQSMKVVFMLGTLGVDSLGLQQKLVTESEQFSDLVQGSFVDTYRNVTYKHVMVFKYSVYHCPRAKYFLKTDDDVFVNMPAMLTFLRDSISPYGAQGLLMCARRTNDFAVRSYRSKWRVSFDEYPSRKYPPYCPGWALLYSPDVLFALYKAAQNSSYFWIDDVLITGVLFEQVLGGKREQMDAVPFMLSKQAQNEIVYKNSSYNPGRNFLYGRPDLNETEIRRLYEFAVQYNKLGIGF